MSPGVPLETLTVYQTAEHPNLEENLRSYFTEQVKPPRTFGERCCVPLFIRLHVHRERRPPSLSSAHRG